MYNNFGAIEISYEEFSMEKFIELIKYIKSNDLLINVMDFDDNNLKVLLSGENIKNRIKKLINEYGNLLSNNEIINEISGSLNLFEKELIELFGFDVTYKLDLTKNNNYIVKHINFKEGEVMENKKSVLRFDVSLLDKETTEKLFNYLNDNNINIVDKKIILERANDPTFDLVRADINYAYLLVEGKNIEEKLQELTDGIADISVIDLNNRLNPFIIDDVLQGKIKQKKYSLKK